MRWSSKGLDALNALLQLPPSLCCLGFYALGRGQQFHQRCRPPLSGGSAGVAVSGSTLCSCIEHDLASAARCQLGNQFRCLIAEDNQLLKGWVTLSQLQG